MPNYLAGKIYCIRNRAAGDGIVYIGSTTQTLSNRMNGHRRDIQRSTMKLHKLMVEVGVDQFHIELVVDFPCERREQLFAKEGEYIRLHRPVGNANIAGRTDKEWHADNRAANLEADAARKKAWREANPEAVAAIAKAYRERNPEAEAARSKAYREANREAALARTKAWRAANPEAVAASKKAYRERNPEAEAARSKAYREANREAALARTKVWRAANPEAVAASKKAYRQRKKAERVAVQGLNVENVTN